MSPLTGPRTRAATSALTLAFLAALLGHNLVSYVVWGRDPLPQTETAAVLQLSMPLMLAFTYPLGRALTAIYGASRVMPFALLALAAVVVLGRVVLPLQDIDGIGPIYMHIEPPTLGLMGAAAGVALPAALTERAAGTLRGRAARALSAAAGGGGLLAGLLVAGALHAHYTPYRLLALTVSPAAVALGLAAWAWPARRLALGTGYRPGLLSRALISGAPVLAAVNLAFITGAHAVTSHYRVTFDALAALAASGALALATVLLAPGHRGVSVRQALLTPNARRALLTAVAGVPLGCALAVVLLLGLLRPHYLWYPGTLTLHILPAVAALALSPLFTPRLPIRGRTLPGLVAAAGYALALVAFVAINDDRAFTAPPVWVAVSLPMGLVIAHVGTAYLLLLPPLYGTRYPSLGYMLGAGVACALVLGAASTQPTIPDIAEVDQIYRAALTTAGRLALAANLATFGVVVWRDLRKP